MGLPNLVWIIFFLSILASSSAERAPYTSFAREATSAPAAEYYDYIIIGGGTAGCAMAATLSAAAKVLLLERGGLPYNNPNVSNIAGFPLTLADTSRSSPAQLFVSTDGVFNHRARILGGGSAINAGFFTRASSQFIEQVGWDPRLVNESYAWVEDKVAFQPRLRQWQAAVRDGLLESRIWPWRGFTYEHLHGTKIGGSIFDDLGRRHTAADLLEYAEPTNIRVLLHATVQRIIFRTRPGRAPKAHGVFYRDGSHRRHWALLRSSAKSEIILCAGALGSPQMLMLSGIGPARHLLRQGIPVILDHPMVGQGMSDNPMNAVIVPSPRPVEISLIQVVGITNSGSYVEAASGFLELAWFHRIAQRYAEIVNRTIPPYESPGNGTNSNGGGMGISQLYQDPTVQAGLILEKIMGPYSTGHLELVSRDPGENPRVTFNYFQDRRDVERCVQGMEVIRRVVESRAVSPFRYPFTSFRSFINLMLSFPNNLRRRHLTAAYSLEQFCRDTVMTIWHYHGGCHVNRVVDGDYKVIGVDALRVVDGSTFASSPGTNPQATVMMLGRYMGQKILQGRSES
ncbi:protein HOTHEAD-like [Andrographis paniculata]|uniref:protein HOTHEAD-like n=1 Tax=Andrographis paniculata TaxID=175694 RepID=UPI0021E7EB39|nr:protein HOTHEAD-like [Andrographis paniculata]